jgi:hypothetical protein
MFSGPGQDLQYETFFIQVNVIFFKQMFDSYIALIDVSSY